MNSGVTMVLLNSDSVPFVYYDFQSLFREEPIRYGTVSTDWTV